MNVINCRVENRHLVSNDINDKLCLLDTGSPITLDKSHPFMDGIVGNTGLDIDYLMGCDYLMQEGAIGFDIRDNKVVLKDSEEGCDEGSVRMSYGVPVLKCGLSHKYDEPPRDMECAFDTGAMQTFISRNALKELGIDMEKEKAGTEDEFLPNGHKFKVDMVMVNAVIKDDIGLGFQWLRCAVFPEGMESLYQSLGDGVEGIIGLDIIGNATFTLGKESSSLDVMFTGKSYRDTIDMID